MGAASLAVHRIDATGHGSPAQECHQSDSEQPEGHGHRRRHSERRAATVHGTIRRNASTSALASSGVRSKEPVGQEPKSGAEVKAFRDFRTDNMIQKTIHPPSG